MYLQKKVALYSVVLRQCTKATENRPKGEGNFDKIDKDSEVIKLLKLNKSISYLYNSKCYPFLAVHQVMKAFYASYQQNTTSCASYLESITNLRNVILHCGRNLENHPFLVNKKIKDAGLDPPSSANDQQIETAKTDAKEDYMSVAFLLGLNCHRYGPLMNELHNEFRMGRYKYSKTLTNAYDL